MTSFAPSLSRFLREVLRGVLRGVRNAKGRIVLRGVGVGDRDRGNFEFTTASVKTGSVTATDCLASSLRLIGRIRFTTFTWLDLLWPTEDDDDDCRCVRWTNGE